MTRAALLLLVLLPAAAHAQSESFIVRLGADTIATETFVRTPTRLEGELSSRAMGVRTRYLLELQGELPVSLRSEIIPAGADTATLRATMQFAGDSVFVQLWRAGAQQPEQRLASRAGAVPFINLSFALVELAAGRALRAPGPDRAVHLFVLDNGATLTAQLEQPGADSAVMTLAGIALHMRLDARGRIQQAAVPAQRVVVERVAGTLERSAAIAPDYSAPSGAHYTAENVVVAANGHTLAGTLTLPRNRAGRVPAVITISGSGPQDRDETIIGLRGYRPFREFAEDLAGRGVAVLRYDDRGYGASTGVYATATTEDFAEDTRAALAWLRARPEIDADRIFLLGHSEGGMVAPMVARADRRLAGIILLAGPGHTGRSILEYQTRNSVELLPGKSPAERDSLIRDNMATLDAATEPWIRYFREYDPLPIIRAVRVPVLIVHGATDRQVTADQADVLARTLRAAGNDDVAVHVLPGVNHLFLSDPNGNVVGYPSLPTRRMVPEVLQIVGEWIAQQSK